MKIRLPPFAWGIVVGLIYGTLTMFPEWLFYTPNNSAISLGAIANLPAISIILIFMDSQKGFGFGDLPDHYLILSLVLIIDALAVGAVFALVSSMFSKRKS